MLSALLFQLKDLGHVDVTCVPGLAMTCRHQHHGLGGEVTPMKCVKQPSAHAVRPRRSGQQAVATHQEVPFNKLTCR
eukprot:scaffold97572_cov73-Phaeocystis_antarctica.AAC.4